MYSEERMLVWRFIFFCNERTDIPKISRESRAERITAEIKAKKYPSPVEALLLDTAFQMINDFDEAEHARRTLKPTAPPEADKPE